MPLLVPSWLGFTMTGKRSGRSFSRPAGSITPEVLRAADAASAVTRKKNAGGTGPESIDAQIAHLQACAQAASSAGAGIPRLGTLLSDLKEARL